MMNGLPRRVDVEASGQQMAPRCLSRAALLLTVFACAAALAASWEDRLHPDDRHTIQQTDATARTVLASVPTEAYGFDEVPAIQALLDARSMARPQERLLGDWRCRSIQLNQYGLFSYPFFRCHIEQLDGGLRFRKSTGSQRRTGWLHADGEARWVFIGSSHYNEDPAPDYSGLREDSDGQNRERDSVGVLETLADGRLRMILDAKPGQVEIYELNR